MKKQLLKITRGFVATSVMAIVSNVVVSQSVVSTFEDLTLSADTFWNGKDLSGGFTSGSNYFYNSYDTAWGGYWSGGFSYSNMENDSVGDYTNMYSAITAEGYASSDNYAIGTNGAAVNSLLIASGAKEVYITNTTYAYYSMLEGDMFAKKFGGTTGDDPDWFKLTINGYNNGSFVDSVEFYLADYRFADNNSDYIVDDWTQVDLLTLGMGVDSLVFNLSSSDVGAWGMNTPAYFAMDNILIDEIGSVRNNSVAEMIDVYPNPAKDIIYVETSMTVECIVLTDLTGKVVKALSVNGLNETAKLDMSTLEKGVYMMNVVSGNETITRKVVKN